MVVIEVAIICFSLVSCVAVCASAYYLSEMKKEQQRQFGITQRAQMKLGTQEGSPSSPYGSQTEWWVPLAMKLIEVPAVQEMIKEKVMPGLLNGMVKKE